MRSGINSKVTSIYNKRPKVRHNCIMNLTDEQKKIIGYIEKSILVDSSSSDDNNNNERVNNNKILNKIMKKKLFEFYSK